MKKNIPKVGVALLAYNQGQFVDGAIESLKRQTFQDFEVILIDDGSNDGFTREKLQSLEYEKITRKYLYKTNIGSPKRRKRCDEMMKNEYIMNYCGDDVLASTFLEKTVRYLDNNSSCGAVCTNLRLFIDDPNDYYYERKYDKDAMKFPDMLVSCNMLGSSLMRRKALNGLDLDWPLRSYYDWNRWNAMLDAGWKLGLVPEPLFYYRQVKTSLSHISGRNDDVIFRKELMRRYSKVYGMYYMEIIRQLYDMLAELQEGKDWLDDQYHSLNVEIERLTNYNNELVKENDILIEANNNLKANNEDLIVENGVLRQSKIRRKIKRMKERMKR